MFADVGVVPDQLVVAELSKLLLTLWCEVRSVQSLDGQVVATDLIEDDHVERCCRGALFDESANVESLGVRTAVQQLMHGSRVAVEREHHIDCIGEQLDELLFGEPVRVIDNGKQRHQVDDIDDANP